MTRVRFAPSPTGELHIGGARTALFNFLWARATGGRLILRIDDTDAERSRRAYEAQLMEDLRWLGLSWDEGPDVPSDVSYRQSERTAIYSRHMDILREKGVAYPCLCPEERLEALREAQLARGEPPRYDGRCRRISPEEAERRMAAGERPCWRLALPDGYAPTFDDIVRGPQTFPPGTIGDFVLQRSDGVPTYLFASAVDDHLMEISHVIRGDEHIPNTARQLAIVDLLDWPRPTFAHIPMVLSADRRKLGKRTGSQPIRELRERGFLPEAISAYLATLSWTPPEGTDPFDLRSLAASFSLGGIARSSPIHDEGHLLHWQRGAMAKRGGEALARSLVEREPALVPYGTRLAPLVEDMISEAPTLSALEESTAFLIDCPDAPHMPWMADLAKTMREVDPWGPDAIEQALRASMKAQGMKGKEFFHPLRLVLTGKDRGAPLPLIIFTLGREETGARLVV